MIGLEIKVTYWNEENGSLEKTLEIREGVLPEELELSRLGAKEALRQRLKLMCSKVVEELERPVDFQYQGRKERLDEQQN